jgi:proton-translocating NADH-quinone oxidoreductase chain N
MNFLLFFENNLIFIFPELFLFLSISVLLMFGVFIQTSKKFIYPNIIKPLCWILIFILFIGFLFIYNSSLNSILRFNNSLIFDSFSNFLKVLILITSIDVVRVSFQYLESEKIFQYEYIVRILLSIISIILLVSSYDLISFYLSIEIQSLCFYVLATFKKENAFSSEAGLKYFILGAFSSGLLLFGSSLIYGYAGSTQFEDLSRLFLITQFDQFISSGIFIGLLFVGISLLFKLTAAPFHIWAPDVYEGSPTIVSLFFSAVPKIAIFGLIIRLFISIFYGLFNVWQPIFIFCALASLLVSVFASLSQFKIKRFLAYSSIGHVGFMLIALASGSIEGVQSLLIYLVIYLITTVGSWTFILALNKFDIISKQKKRLVYINDLNYLGYDNPLLAFTRTIIIFSIAGIPPLAGFCAKIYVLFAAIESSLYFLSFVAVLTSCIGAFYYIRFIKVMYFENKNKSQFYFKLDRQKSILLGICFFLILSLFFYSNFLLVLTHKLAVIVCL